MPSLDINFHDKVVIVHAVVACLAVLGTVPAALLVQRWAKIRGTRSRYHGMLNIGTGILLTIAFALGTAAVKSQGEGYQFSGPSRDLHHDLGLVLFLLVMIQVAMGLVIVNVKGRFSGSSGKGVTRWVHIALGCTIGILLIVQTWNGFDEWNSMQSTGTLTPDAVRYVFVIVIGLEVATYVFLAARSSLLSIDQGSGPWSRLATELSESETALPEQK